MPLADRVPRRPARAAARGARPAPPPLGRRHDVGRGRRGRVRSPWRCRGPRPGVAAAAHTARALGHRARARLRHGRHDDRRVPDRRRRAGDGGAAEARRLPGAAADASPSSPSARAAAPSPASRRRRARSRWARTARARCPGRRAYGQGGTAPTVTDANLILGYLNPDRGLRRLHPHRPRRGPEAALAPLAPALRPRPSIEAAHGVVEVANASMLRALRLVSVQRGYDLRELRAHRLRRRGPAPRGRARAAGGDAPAWSCPRTPAPSPRSAASSRRCATTPCRRTARAVDGWDAEGGRGPLPRARAAVPARRSLDEGHALGPAARARGASTCATSGRTTRSSVPFGDRRPRRAAGGLRARGTASSTATPRARASSASTCASRRSARPTDGGAAAGAPARRASARRAGGLASRVLPGDGRGRRCRATTAPALPPAPCVAGPAMVEDEWSTTIVYPGQRAAPTALGNLVIESEAAA